MPKLIMTVGLPASGKSTWAKQQVAKSGGNIKRVNKDDLRDMIDAGKWGKNNEKHILKVRDNLVEHYLHSGYSVIVDDTNLAPKHEATLKELATKLGATFETKSFLDVSLKTCIERDLKRPISVGERVIRQMYDNYLKPDTTKAEAPKWIADAPVAIICDIDGTLAHMSGRSPYEWDKVGEDTLDRVVAHILETYRSHYHNAGEKISIIMLSGRDGSCRDLTFDWLVNNGVQFDELYMREAGDMRKDNIVKRELYEQHIAGKYNVEFVLDDRNQVVDMWRNELGLKVLQVAEGDF